MLNTALRESARKFTGRVALICGDRSLTYDEVYDRACRLANLLSDAGITPGDRVAILGDSGIYAFDEFTACALGGFVRAPLYMQDTPQRQAFMLHRIDAKALIIDEAAWHLLRPELGEEGTAQFRLILVRGSASHSLDSLDYDTALTARSPTDPGIPEQDDATYVVRFSAGTTGMPKPISHTRRAYFLANLEVLSCTAPVDETDVYLAVSPYSHASGNLVWPFLAAGGRHVVMQGRFDAGEAIDLISKHGCTTLFLVPTMIQRLLESNKGTPGKLSAIRRVLYGAAPIPRPLIKQALEVFGDGLCQLYGQSEMVPVTCLSPEDHRADENGDTGRLGSAGRPTANSAIRIESPEGDILKPGEVGEIVGRSPGMMEGIFGDPEATAQRFTADGWLRTGDVGWIDADGFLHVVDRLDDMIISGGFNISPFEIEDALCQHIAVAEAIAFGVPDATWGATPMAVVRLRQGARATPEELIEWCRSAVGKLKKPSFIVLTDAPLPTNAAGKLLRREARKIFAAAGGNE